jgi:DnaJ-domain-containing protein 1
VKDAFELLGLPRQAALDETEIQARHHERIAEVHPDKATNPEEREAFSGQSQELNQAAQTLKNPATRIRHLLDLIAPGEKHDAGLDEALMNLFSTVGAAVQGAQQLLAKKSAASSALAKALLADDEIQAQERLQAALGEVTRAENALDFGASETADLRRLYTKLSFLDKWRRQINELLLGLISG